VILTLDIETIPDQSTGSRDAFLADARANFKAPSTLTKEQAAVDLGLTDSNEIKFTSKAAMIERWQVAMAGEKADSVGDEAWRKTSFNGLYGSIACVCYSFDDEENIFSLDCLDGEAKMLERFYSHIHERSSVQHVTGSADIPLTVCGHNIVDFDMPFLYHRSVIHGVKPAPAMLKAMKSKHWDSCIADTMKMWCSDSQKRTSMDALCKAFGLEGKGDFDGSMVADAWPTDPAKVIAYCQDDVRRTRAMYKRMTWSA